MTKRHDHEMQISEHELLAMTRDLDDMHHATLPAMHTALAEWAELQREAAGDGGHGTSTELTGPELRGPELTVVALAPLPDPSLGDDARTAATTGTTGSGTVLGSSRRRFLIGAGAAVGGLLLAACSSTTTTTTASGGKNPYSGDVAVAALAASLENLAVQTYGAGISAAQAGKLGQVPPAIVTFATTAQSQHKAHAGAWNSILSNAGKPMVTGVDKTVQDAVVTPGFAQVKNATDLAKFALVLEDSAAATYLSAISALSSMGNINIAATIQPVEMQHAAILNLVVGNYPVPASFATMAGARTTSDTIG